MIKDRRGEQRPVATPRLATFDSCKIDDTDNRLFGITAQVSRAATPADQPLVRTLLHLTKN
ncbi:hypothetical protein VRZ08_24180 [Rhodopseudomonas sp. G2_2311]|uniref:hypothetical protein n=1 Tax=Rhodopseudomonas sp. G2_2311 TaxID=3114287 RepID=UPI0039C61D47